MLDRLDEETEEDTEVGGSLTEDEGSLGSYTARTTRFMDTRPEQSEGESESASGSGLVESEHSSSASADAQQSKAEDEGESTIGGVSSPTSSLTTQELLN